MTPNPNQKKPDGPCNDRFCADPKVCRANKEFIKGFIGGVVILLVVIVITKF